jgi:hypothetical protein
MFPTRRRATRGRLGRTLEGCVSPVVVVVVVVVVVSVVVVVVMVVVVVVVVVVAVVVVVVVVEYMDTDACDRKWWMVVHCGVYPCEVG